MKKIYIAIACSLLCTTLHAQDGFGTYLRDVIQKQEKGMLVAAKLTEACGLCDSMDLLMDYNYEKLYQQGVISDYYDWAYGNRAYLPEHRYYGYTLFAETDDFWEEAIGKDYKAVTPADVRDYIVALQLYPDATTGDDYASPDNVLYRFVTYHLLPMRVRPDKLVLHFNEYGYSAANPDRLSIPVMEYYTTMGERRLLKTYESAESGGIYLNRFPAIDNARKGTGHEMSCDPDKQGLRIDVEHALTEIPNAIVYPISGLLADDEPTRHNLGRERIRFDVTSQFPEFMSNDIRKYPVNDERHQHVYIPPTRQYPYLDALTISDETRCIYYNAYGYDWCNLQGDELKFAGRYDVTLRLPPVPVDGVYELRLCMLANNNRGICQVYFGTNKENLPPLGLPINLAQGLKNAQDRQFFGWEDDTGDDAYNALVDLRLRQHSVMKGAKSVNSKDGTERGANDSENVRRILWRGQMKAGETYYVRFRSVMDSTQKELYMDYFELCPESVFDNPEKPEDIW